MGRKEKITTQKDVPSERLVIFRLFANSRITLIYNGIYLAFPGETGNPSMHNHPNRLAFITAYRW